MKLAIESSTLAQKYVQEVGSYKLDHLVQYAPELALCFILVRELISGLNRQLKEGASSITDYREAKMYYQQWTPCMSHALLNSRQVYLSPHTENN
ncbi:MAG: hypothetical protein JRH08_08520 [Deltaproteobacteria bacterium]|nr:hypothetical protein [Deltaproteobacteria bacterium]MBW1930839.1 hypothetical protein [Deltaproteobacteria bacterium]MBW2025649.1 hypothetical protein [Deltaproteobacteria bacterium]MBW2125725.1 hypothetical protein [Deltaproteobacteria bacterium]